MFCRNKLVNVRRTFRLVRFSSGQTKREVIFITAPQAVKSIVRTMRNMATQGEVQHGHQNPGPLNQCCPEGTISTALVASLVNPEGQLCNRYGHTLWLSSWCALYNGGSRITERGFRDLSCSACERRFCHTHLLETNARISWGEKRMD